MSDLIRREDAIEVAYQLRHKPIDEEWNWWRKAFSAIPSADRPKGEWIEINIKDYKAKCSNCRTWSVVMGNYCPNCGADMRGEDNES